VAVRVQERPKQVVARAAELAQAAALEQAVVGNTNL